MVEETKPLGIAPIGPREHAGAVECLRRFSDQDLTLADAMGLFLIKHRGIRTCWSSDLRLGLTGATLVIHPQ